MTFRGFQAFRWRAATALTLLSALGAGSLALAQQGGLTGDATRGERYYTAGYKCFACHGYDAVSGARRLIPMNYTQDGFITFVQNSPLPQMPAYNDMPDQALADVYAYISSKADDSRAVEDIALLSDILERTRTSMEN